jgi:hypothetical protein
VRGPHAREQHRRPWRWRRKNKLQGAHKGSNNLWPKCVAIVTILFSSSKLLNSKYINHYFSKIPNEKSGCVLRAGKYGISCICCVDWKLIEPNALTEHNGMDMLTVKIPHSFLQYIWFSIPFCRDLVDLRPAAPLLATTWRWKNWEP